MDKVKNQMGGTFLSGNGAGKINESEGVDHEIAGNSLKARSREKRIDRACFMSEIMRG